MEGPGSEQQSVSGEDRMILRGRQTQFPNQLCHPPVILMWGNQLTLLCLSLILTVRWE